MEDRHPGSSERQRHMSKRNSIMQPITHTTTNTQIAVCAAALYYRDGAPPALCERLITTCLHIDSLPDDDEALTQQALIQAHETWDRLDVYLARVIASRTRKLQCEREAARDSRAGDDALHAAGLRVISVVGTVALVGRDNHLPQRIQMQDIEAAASQPETGDGRPQVYRALLRQARAMQSAQVTALKQQGWQSWEL